MLDASAVTVGLIESLAEATALIVKVFSGALSDYLGKRKGPALFGYTLGALTKPLFAIAPTIGIIFTARLLDRIGKEIRSAPRDALVADITPPEIRGAAFGLRQSLNTVGLFLDRNRPVASKPKVQATHPKEEVKVIIQDKLH